MEGLIGSFLIEDIISHDWTEHNYDATIDASATAPPSLLRDVLSRYNHDNNDTRQDQYQQQQQQQHQQQHHQKQQYYRRILLTGSHIITSSLLFDFAISLASSVPCRCRCNTSSSLDGNTGNTHGNECENCVAVTVIRSAARQYDTNAGPIMCQPQQQQDDTSRTSPSISSKKRRLDTVDRHRIHFPTAFRRVQIIYVNGIEDILHYLLTMASQPPSRQPLGGIFIDQLDDILLPQYQDYRDDIATNTMRMSQIVAILVDTVSFMEKSHRCLPTIVITVQHRTDTFPNASSLPSVDHELQHCSIFWSPLHLTVVPVAVTNNEEATNHDDETATSVFRLTMQQRKSHDPLVLATLTLTESIANETQIIWNTAIND